MCRVDPYRTEIYTAEQIDEMLSHIAPSETYSKSEIDAMVSDINDDIDTKQDTLTAGTGIDITNNIISATGGNGWTQLTGNDWSSFMDVDISQGTTITKDVLIYQYGKLLFAFPKGYKYGSNDAMFINSIVLSDGKLRKREIKFDYANATVSTLPTVTTEYTLDISTGLFSQSNINSTINKNTLVVFVKD